MIFCILTPMSRLSKHISISTSLAFLWMTFIPILTVCGMMADSVDANEVTPVSCCPVEAMKTAESQQKQLCHPLNDAKPHSCEICPCEFKASMLTVKTASMVVSEADEILPSISFLEVDELLPNTDTNEYFPQLIKNTTQYSGPPTFIRNCTWLI